MRTCLIQLVTLSRRLGQKLSGACMVKREIWALVIVVVFLIFLYYSLVTSPGTFSKLKKRLSFFSPCNSEVALPSYESDTMEKKNGVKQMLRWVPSLQLF